MLRIILLFVFVLDPKGFFKQTASNTSYTIEHSTIHIKNTSNAIYSLSSAGQLQQAFGKTKVTKERDEMLGGYAYTHKYNGLEVYFNENNFETITVTGSQYRVYLNDEVFQVGDNEAKLKKAFSLAYAQRSADSNNTKTLRIQIRYKKRLTDAAVTMTLNTRGIISNIWIGNNNS